MARKYRLTLTEDHLHAIMRATEFHERIAMGQFREIFDVVDPGFHLSREDRDQAEQFLILARRYLMPELQSDNAYHSIRSTAIDDTNRVLYDILQVVRHRLAWDRKPEGDWTINFDRPMRTSAELDLIEVEEVPQSSSEASLAQSGSRMTGSSGSSKSGSKSGRGSRKTASAKKPTDKPVG